MAQLPIVRTFCDLIAAYAEYVGQLEDECKSLGGLASAHGWRCPPERVKRGEELRAKIAELRDELPPLKK
jgi:hypothetical protein